MASDQTPEDPAGTGPEPDDRTQRLPAGGADATGPPPADSGATRELPADGDATGVLPAGEAAGEAAGESPPAAWAGRAQVRPPRPPGDDPGSTEEWEGPAEPGRRWWLPILLGLLALLILGALIAGIWLIAQALSGDDPTPPPLPTGTPAATSSPTPTRAASPEPPPETEPAPSPEPSATTEPPPTTSAPTTSPPPPPTPTTSPTGDGGGGGRRG